MFYMSEYLESNREEYYDRLLAISKDKAWTAWVVFFLKGVKAQAENNLKKAMAIHNLYETQKPKAIEASHSQYAVFALDWIFSRPVFKASDFVANVGIPVPSAKRQISVLRKLGILKCLQEGSGRRSAIYAACELLNIAEGYEAF
ncbi:hypothetical protein SDC9_194287 [bioreactor metagenome]|uniref:Uncharacterized protein n=1 Tax=bioreactor metagenome TaxID=1076179 RepID=A0A645I6G4_9ZZZZ